MSYRDKFKKFGGDFIPDVIEYIKTYIEKWPNLTISVGCDSIQLRKKTTYAFTITMYNGDARNGAHVIFYRESLPRIRDNFERLHNEAMFTEKIADFLQTELEPSYVRRDLNDRELKRYKYHILKSNGEYKDVSIHDEDKVISNLHLSETEFTFKYKLVDLHLDFNPNETRTDSRGFARNKSFLSYKTYVPWLRGMGYRVFSKPMAFGASSAADLLLQD
jgi:predicted RNase H-related nuclease YkuK (DUF458 family)